MTKLNGFLFLGGFAILMTPVIVARYSITGFRATTGLLVLGGGMMLLGLVSWKKK